MPQDQPTYGYELKTCVWIEKQKFPAKFNQMTLGMEMMSFKKRHTDAINKFGHALSKTEGTTKLFARKSNWYSSTKRNIP